MKSDTAEQRRGIDEILSIEKGGGALCNDASGLCIGSRGNISTTQAGAYTNIAKLASQLSGEEGDSNTGGKGKEEQQKEQQQHQVNGFPLITIETDEAALLVKEYDGHTVVVRVPVRRENEVADTGKLHDTTPIGEDLVDARHEEHVAEGG